MWNNRTMKISFLFASLLFSCQLLAQPIIERVSLTPNAAWELLSNDISDSAASIGYKILNEKLPQTTKEINGLFRVNYVPLPVTVNHIQIEYFANALGMQHVLTANEETNWKTSLFVGKDSDPQTLALHRLGVNNGVVLEFLMFFPNIKPDEEDSNLGVLTFDQGNVNSENMSGIAIHKAYGNQIIDIFKEVCSTLEIDELGEPSLSVKIIEPPMNSDVYRQRKN
jgi:hypothetical protein